MSGHNKWSKIHRKKQVLDQKRGNLFTKLGRNIAIAVKKGGGGDPESNFALRLAIEKAKAVNMPKKNIEKAIQRGLGKTGAGELQELVLEGYGPEGVAVIVEAVTDNRNRTVAEMKNLFERHGGSLGSPGSVMYMFDRKGIVSFEGHMGEDELLELIDKGVEDVDQDDRGGSVLVVNPSSLQEVMEYLKAKKVQQLEGEVMYRAKIEKEASDKVNKFLDVVRAHDDVQEVYANVVSE